MCNRSDTIPACDRQADRQTNRQTSWDDIVRTMHMRRAVKTATICVVWKIHSQINYVDIPS